jgi:tetratricopeptide (TPR) repeat protein
MIHTWQWEEAEKEFKRAIELNPNYPPTHHWYGLHFATIGKLDD